MLLHPRTSAQTEFIHRGSLKVGRYESGIGRSFFNSLWGDIAAGE